MKPFFKMNSRSLDKKPPIIQVTLQRFSNLYKEKSRKPIIETLSSENMLFFTVDPPCGTDFLSIGKYVIQAKSPLTYFQGNSVSSSVWSLAFGRTRFNSLSFMIPIMGTEFAYNKASAYRLNKKSTFFSSRLKEVCPREKKTGIIRVKKNKCNDCVVCIGTYEFVEIALHPVTKMLIVWDLCGGDPKCILHSLREALSFAPSEQTSQKARKKVDRIHMQE
jgi:hypothetical protein